MSDGGPDWLTEWRDRVLDASRFASDPMPLADSPSWELRKGRIRHRSRRYFSIVGVEEPSGRSYPLILQPDIGLLGFLVTGPAGRTRWLAQMKPEPGNVGGAQLAPTVQATRSNLDRVHRGSAPALADWFASGSPVLADGTWSEQGSRFLGKRNRNATIEVPHPFEPDGLLHRWIGALELRTALGSDFAVNTDARSAIATAPWRLLGGPEPFSDDLRRSHRHHDPAAIEAVAPALRGRRPARLRTVALETIGGGSLDPTSATPLRHPHFDVVHRSVTAALSEVPRWDQPLASSSRPGRVELRLVPWPDGILRAELGIDEAPGLVDGAEVTASSVSSPGTEPFAWSPGRTLAAALVSDEGGRLDHEITEIRVVQTDGPTGAGPLRLALGDLERLVRTPMATTNELRSAVAVLLSLA